MKFDNNFKTIFKPSTEAHRILENVDDIIGNLDESVKEIVVDPDEYRILRDNLQSHYKIFYKNFIPYRGRRLKIKVD